MSPSLDMLLASCPLMGCNGPWQLVSQDVGCWLGQESISTSLFIFVLFFFTLKNAGGVCQCERGGVFSPTVWEQKGKEGRTWRQRNIE